MCYYLLITMTTNKSISKENDKYNDKKKYWRKLIHLIQQICKALMRNRGVSLTMTILFMCIVFSKLDP